MSERRKIDRLSPLVIRADYPCGEDRRNGYMTNLSEAGAFLATDEDFAIGETLDLRFVLPWGLGEHEVSASVIWRTKDMGEEPESIPTGVGLCFHNLASEVKESIRRYMRKFYELLAQIEDRGLNEVLASLSRDPSSETVH